MKPPAKEEKDEGRGPGDENAEWDEELQEEQKGDSRSRRGMKMIDEGKAGRQAGGEDGQWQQGKRISTCSIRASLTCTCGFT